MNFFKHSAAAVSNPRAYSVKDLLSMERFSDCVSSAVEDLLETHCLLPRKVRYVADVQKWMLSQATLALHFENSTDPTRPAITPSDLVRYFGKTPAASKNTVLAFLMEMRHYSFVEPVEVGDRRRRGFRATPESEALIRRYFDIHMRALDLLDNGSRYRLSSAEPKLLHHAQPKMTRLLFQRPEWWHPPETIATFVKSDAGSNIVHHLVTRAPKVASDGDRLWIGPVSPTELSRRFHLSRTHTVRMFARARRDGLLGWQRNDNRGDCWIAPQLLRDYRYWQATKFAAMSQAVHDVAVSVADFSRPLPAE